ncbi:hypothetical protein Efla_007449 [Eimeria flavescens]
MQLVLPPPGAPTEKQHLPLLPRMCAHPAGRGRKAPASVAAGYETFSLHADRMRRAFANLLSEQEEGAPLQTGSYPPFKGKPLRLHTGYFDPYRPEGLLQGGPTAAGRPASGEEEGLVSTQAHALCLIAFLRRLEQKEKLRRRAQQQPRCSEPSLYVHREILQSGLLPPPPASTAGSDADNPPPAAAAGGGGAGGEGGGGGCSSSGPSSKGPLRGPLTVKWTGNACRTVQVAGTFSDPPWSRCVDLQYEQTSGVFVADMREAVSPGKQAKDLQIKFLVDGQWRLEATLPRCQDSGGNWNNKWLPQDAFAPPEDTSPLTRSLFTAAARAAAAQAQAAAAKDTPAAAGAAGGTATASRSAQQENNTENIWWPRYATQEEIEGFIPRPSILGESGRSSSTRYPLEPSGGPPSACSLADNLRRVRSMSLSLSTYPRSVTSYLHPPEMLLGLGPTGQARQERAREGLSLQCGFFLLPHPDKTQTGGADAYFICCRGEGRGVAVGVADGVGEWDSFDLDPRLFAEELMQGCCAAAAAAEALEGETIEQRTLGVLRKGYAHTRSFGSATALVVNHEGGDRIGIANLGDSAVIVLRRQLWYQMTCVFRSREQQHQFNCPFQLSRLPRPSEYERLRASGKEALLRLLQNAAVIPEDTPESASLCSVSVMEGDLIILGTDGVFDNLFDFEICGIANLTLSPFEARLLDNEAAATSATAVATAIGEAAAHRSRSLTAKTPFMRHARQEGSLFSGGKMDDITVLACWVTSPGALLPGSADISGFCGPAFVSRGL